MEYKENIFESNFITNNYYSYKIQLYNLCSFKYIN